MFLMFLTRISNFVQIRQFSIRSINLFFMHNFRPQKLELNHLIDDITIDVLFFFNFTSIQNIIRTDNRSND